MTRRSSSRRAPCTCTSPGSSGSWPPSASMGRTAPPGWSGSAGSSPGSSGTSTGPIAAASEYRAARPRGSPLPEGGRAVRFLIGLDQQGYGLDQGQVGERLREIAHVLAGAGVDLLRVQLQRPGERQQLLAQGACALRFTDHGQRTHQPEGADGEGPLLALEPRVGPLDLVAQDQAVLGQLV